MVDLPDLSPERILGPALAKLAEIKSNLSRIWIREKWPKGSFDMDALIQPPKTSEVKVPTRSVASKINTDDGPLTVKPLAPASKRGVSEMVSDRHVATTGQHVVNAKPAQKLEPEPKDSSPSQKAAKGAKEPQASLPLQPDALQDMIALKDEAERLERQFKERQKKIKEMLNSDKGQTF